MSVKTIRVASRKDAFTLIELLIVVAIIAILAAIAVPNFLEAQTRSKVSRVKSDMRSLATALESYQVDNNKYPYWATDPQIRRNRKADDEFPFIGYTPRSITTPIAYMTSLPQETFKNIAESTSQNFNPNPLNLFMYDWEKNFNIYNVSTDIWPQLAGASSKWVLASLGPDRFSTVPNSFGPTNNIVEIFQNDPDGGVVGVNMYYDPTNGTISNGDIFLSGPGGGYDYRDASSFERNN